MNKVIEKAENFLVRKSTNMPNKKSKKKKSNLKFGDAGIDCLTK